VTEGRSLLAAERHNLILAVLARDGAVRIADLVEMLDVSAMTIRRDLLHLEREGYLQRVHGGAVRARSVTSDRSTPARKLGILGPGRDASWRTVARAAEQRAQDQGYGTVLHSRPTHGTVSGLTDIERVLESDAISGFVLATHSSSPAAIGELVRWLSGIDLPYVLVEPGARTETAESISCDHTLGLKQTVRHLTELGHRRLGLVLQRSSPLSRRLARAWRIACSEFGLTPDEHFTRLVTDGTSVRFQNDVAAVLASARSLRTTGLVLYGGTHASELTRQATIQGMSIPADLSIVIYGDDATSASLGLTAVALPHADMGRIAMDLLIHRLAHPEGPRKRILVSPEFVQRTSTAVVHP